MAEGFRFFALVTGNDTDPAYVAASKGKDGTASLGMLWRINGAAIFVKGANMIPMDEQAEVKELWPDRTIMLAGGLTPNQGVTETLERMQHYVEDYDTSGLKLYTFDSTPKKGWWFDDTELAYPMWEKARELGIKNIGCHKGIPFGQFMARYAHAEDFDRVCDDFLDLNFIAFHSAWPYHSELAALKAFKPQRNNLYCEIGTTFAATVSSRPLECAHVLGTLVGNLGSDYVLWGTDSLLWGNPQWQPPPGPPGP